MSPGQVVAAESLFAESVRHASVTHFFQPLDQTVQIALKIADHQLESVAAQPTAPDLPRRSGSTHYLRALD